MTHQGPPIESQPQQPDMQAPPNYDMGDAHPAFAHMPPPAVPSRTFAVLALVLGILAFLTGFVPFLGLLLGIAAVVLGILALRKHQPKGLSITGLSLGGVAVLAGLSATMLVGAALESSPPKSQSDHQVQVEEKEVKPAPEAEKKAPKEVAPPVVEEKPVEIGTVENPAKQPYVAEGIFGGEKYSLTGTIVDANAAALVQSWNMFNDAPPAGFKYVVVELSMTGIDPDGVEPSIANFDLFLATGEGNRYSNEFLVLGEGMSSMSDGPTLYPGSSFTGYTAYIVPEAADAFFIYDNGTFVSF